MMKFNRILLSGLLALTVGAAASPAFAQVRVFHSPGDDGTSPAQLEKLPVGPHTLHLYLATGSTPSQNEPCHLGNGDEVCQWVIRVAGKGPVTFQSFSPVGDVRWKIDGTKFSATGGDFALGQLGTFKLGDLVIDSAGASSVSLAYGEVASADLSRLFVETGVLPEASTAPGLLTGILGLAILGYRRLKRLA